MEEFEGADERVSVSDADEFANVKSCKQRGKKKKKNHHYKREKMKPDELNNYFFL